MKSSPPDRTRVSLVLVGALWVSAFAMMFLGFRLKHKPLLVMGALDVLLALGATTLVFGKRARS